MAGFEVTPPSPSSATRCLSSPPAIRLRRMKSSHTDCPYWRSDATAPDAVGGELLVGGHTQRHLAPGREEEHFGSAAGGIREDVGSLREARGGPVLRPIDGGEGLTGQDQAHGLVAEL